MSESWKSTCQMLWRQNIGPEKIRHGEIRHGGIRGIRELFVCQPEISGVYRKLKMSWVLSWTAFTAMIVTWKCPSWYAKLNQLNDLSIISHLFHNVPPCVQIRDAEEGMFEEEILLLMKITLKLQKENICLVAKRKVLLCRCLSNQFSFQLSY